MDEIVVGLIAAAATLIGIFLKERFEDRNKEFEEKNRLNLDYLNPLRFFLEETYFRLKEIHESSSLVDRVLRESDKEAQNEPNFVTALDRCRTLYLTGNPEDISDQPDVWFTREGVYLISSTYTVACLFLYIKKLKEDLPYVQLNYKRIPARNRFISWIKQPFRGKYYTRDDDTILLNLLHEVSRAFLYDNGIYYALQPTIGHQMYSSEQERFITYSEYVELVRISSHRIWFDRLFQFFMEASGWNYFDTLASHDQISVDLDLSQEKYKSRSQSLVWAINALGLVSIFLDRAVGGGPSISKRLASESHSLRYNDEILSMAELNKVLEQQLQKQREELQKVEEARK